jgi:hypothetical protein
MIVLNKPVVTLATTQTIVVKQMQFQTDRDGWCGEIKFDVLNQDGIKVSEQRVKILPADWNAFWNAFNSGTFIYQQADNILSWGVKVADNSMENDFVNK